MGRLEKEEINRKLLHILALVLPVFIFYGPSLLDLSRTRVSWVVFGAFLFSLAFDFMRLSQTSLKAWFFAKFGSMLRVEEESQLTGATYILAGSFICSGISLVGENLAASVFLCLTLFILGDAAAALVGKGFGRIKIGNKSLEGAVGCFLLCFLLSNFIFPYLPDFLQKWGGNYTMGNVLMISLAISLLELFPIKFGRFTLNDNLYVPAVASMLVLI